MNEGFQDEVEAINSIYGDGTLTYAGENNIYVVHLPQHEASVRLDFPPDYPSSPPSVLGSHSSGGHTRKGEAARIVDIFREALGRLFQPGEVCIFDVIEDVNNTTPSSIEQQIHETPEDKLAESDDHADINNAIRVDNQVETQNPPPWTVSDVVIELKSVFIGRAAAVTSPEQAKEYLQHLLDTDKRVRSATHNITAWRIRGENGVTFQDCDDDGETAAGGRVLHLMQLMDLWNVMIVVTRWYGGHQLGPKRFSIINTVARDAFVKGSFVEEPASKKKGKR